MISNNLFKKDFIFSIIFFGFVIFQSYLYLNNVFISDELILFQKYSKINSIQEFLLFPNDMSYGSFYYQLNFLISHIGPHPLYVIKLFYLIISILNVYIPIVIINKLTDSNKFNVFYLTLILSSLMVWWQGKQTGVEYLSVFFIVLSLYFCINKKKYLSFFIYGLAFGLKLNALFILPFFLFLQFHLDNLKFKNNFSSSIKLILLFIFGFLFSNIFLLLDPSRFILPLSLDNYRSLDHVLFSDEIGWDGVFNGALNNYGYPLICYFILFIFLAKNKILLLSFYSSILLSIILSLKSWNLFGWYFFPIYIIFPIVISLLKIDNKYSSFLNKEKLILITTFITLIINGRFINQEINNRLESINSHKEIKYLSEFIDHNYENFDGLVELTDFNLAIESNKQVKLLNIDNFEKNTFSYGDYSNSFSRLYKNPFIDLLVSFRDGPFPDHSKKHDGCNILRQYGNVLFIVHEKYLKDNVWYSGRNNSYKNWVDKNIVKRCGNFEIKNYNFYKNHHIFLLRNYD